MPLTRIIGKKEIATIRKAERFIKQWDERNVVAFPMASQIWFDAGYGSRGKTLADNLADALYSFESVPNDSYLRYQSALSVLYWRDKAYAWASIGTGDAAIMKLRERESEIGQLKQKLQETNTKLQKCQDRVVELETENDGLRQHRGSPLSGGETSTVEEDGDSDDE